MLQDKLNDYYKIQKEIYDYFEYVENWHVYPIDDATEYFWSLDEYNEVVYYAEEEEHVDNGTGTTEDGYSASLCGGTAVYRKDQYTLVIADTETDNNKFLMIFDNSKERILDNDTDDEDEFLRSSYGDTEQ